MEENDAMSSRCSTSSGGRRTGIGTPRDCGLIRNQQHEENVNG